MITRELLIPLLVEASPIERFLLPKTARLRKKVHAFWERGEIITDD